MDRDELRKKVQNRMSQKQDSGAETQGQVEQKIKQLEQMVKPIMSKDAWLRYKTLKMAHQDKALKALMALFQLKQSGRLKDKIGDEEFKKILKKLD